MTRQVMFFRYQRNTLALNHIWGKKVKNALPILPCSLCLQYPEYKELMDAANKDLAAKKDGKWVYDPEYGWQLYPIEPLEEFYCKLALRYYRKPSSNRAK